MGLTDRQAKEAALKIQKEQLKNVYWLNLFEDDTCSVVCALGDSIIMEIGERLGVKVSHLFLYDTIHSCFCLNSSTFQLYSFNGK